MIEEEWVYEVDEPDVNNDYAGVEFAKEDGEQVNYIVHKLFLTPKHDKGQ